MGLEGKSLRAGGWEQGICLVEIISKLDFIQSHCVMGRDNHWTEKLR